jgi:hypothetical protein
MSGQRHGTAGDFRCHARWPGRVVQVVSMEPVLKAPATKRSKLGYDEPLSNVAFDFNLRWYIEGDSHAA